MCEEFIFLLRIDIIEIVVKSFIIVLKVRINIVDIIEVNLEIVVKFVVIVVVVVVVVVVVGVFVGGHSVEKFFVVG